MPTKTVNKPRKITLEERLHYSKEQVRLLDKVTDLEAQIKDFATSTKEEIRGYQKDETKYRTILRTGIIFEPHDCEEVTDVDRGVSLWTSKDTGEVLEETPIPADRLRELRQRDFDFMAREKANKEAREAERELEEKARKTAEKARSAQAKEEKAPTSPPALQVVETPEEKEARALALQESGKSYAQVGEAIGVDRNKARRLVEKAREAVAKEPEGAVATAVKRLRAAMAPFSSVKVSIGGESFQWEGKGE